MLLPQPPRSTPFPYTTLFRSVKARQYTGRIVTVTNARIFDEPVYNYTREFPYIWDEITLPVSYKDDRECDLVPRSEEHTSELQSRPHLVCRLLLEKKNSIIIL